jgi:beta-phosphoglucomutase
LIRDSEEIHSRAHFLFDWDGTLADSSSLHEEAFKKILKDAGADYLRAFDYHEAKGLTTDQVLRRLGIENDILRSRMVAEKQKLYRDSVHRNGLSLIEGTQDLLQFLSDKGVTMYIITGSSRISCDTGLRRTGIERFFKGVVTSDDVPINKPDPAIYRYCIHQFSLDVRQCLAVEDARNGVVSARAAGLDVVGVNNSDVADWSDWFFPSIEIFRNFLAGKNAP